MKSQRVYGLQVTRYVRFGFGRLLTRARAELLIQSCWFSCPRRRPYNGLHTRLSGTNHTSKSGTRSSNEPHRGMVLARNPFPRGQFREECLRDEPHTLLVLTKHRDSCQHGDECTESIITGGYRSGDETNESHPGQRARQASDPLLSTHSNLLQRPCLAHG